MKLIKKSLAILFIFLVVFGFVCTMSANGETKTGPKLIKKEIEVQTKDLRIIKASLSYVKIENLQKYPTVVLLHSLGYSSAEWSTLIPTLNNAGYAVIAIDLRGHGKSIYNSKFKKEPWIYFKSNTYQKMPSDVVAVLEQAQKQFKKISLDNYAIVGADIGANTAVLAAKEIKKKPRTLVLISPTISFKGLYIPIAMAEMGPIPILSMVSNKDRYCLKEQLALSKFSQGGFYAENYPQGGMGMMMLKTNPSMAHDITKWLIKYLK